MFNSIGGTEWLIVLLIIILLFGGKKIPELFKGIGEAVKQFKEPTGSEGKKE